MVWRTYQRLLCDNFCKLLQRQTYTFLSSRHGVFLCFIALIATFLSLVQFGEVALEWSVARYQKTLSPYTDNILRQSYQRRLCLPMPIDIVYTWVNGTDPKLRKQLAKLRNELGDNLNASSAETKHKKSSAQGKSRDTTKSFAIKDQGKTTEKPKDVCPYENCVPLNSLIMNIHTEAKLIDLKTIDPIFQNAIRISNISRKPSSSPNARQSLLTVVTFSNENSVKLAVNRAYIINGEKVVTQRAYLTSQSVELAVRMKAMAIVSVKGASTSGNQSLKHFLQLQFGQNLKKLDYYEGVKVAVLTFKDDESYNEAIKLKKGQVMFQKHPLDFQPVMLVWEPFTNIANSDDNHFSASRFADNNEMRYSLRSVEKHAPWVRKIFIVTNGQIPSWLNLDNPRVKVVTHSEIFSNQSHLPTFSSPAIESHLHRIPGLSKKFIYLNDDVMFGKDVWPDDFFTHAKGQKVFLSWPVPNCNEGCPTSWINDKYCDKACNVSDCDWDGGDCLGPKAVPPKWQNVINKMKQGKIYEFCNSGCADTWIGDRYCDAACNNPSCGLDAGDCGVDHFSQLHSTTLYEHTKIIHLPKGLHAMYFNLSNIFGQGKITEGEQNDSPVLRSITISQKFKVMTLTFYPNVTLTTISLRLAGLRTINTTSQLEIKFNITVDTTGSLVTTVANHPMSKNVVPTSESVQHVPTTLYPIRIYNSSNEVNYWNAVGTDRSQPTWKPVDQKEYCIPKIPDDMTIPEDLMRKIQELEKDLKAGDITEKGYKRKTAKLFKERLGITCDFYPTLVHSEMRYMKAMTAKIVDKVATDSTPVQQKSPPKYSTGRQLTSIYQDGTVWSFLPWERQGTFKAIQKLQEEQLLKESYKTVKLPQRTLLDAFSGSLSHVNRIYNRAFGYKSRKVPSHMPHMVDVDIMNELQERFHDEFDKTSSHKLRSPDDMQFALSYFYYIIDQPKEFNMTRLFNEVDIDKSGALSDRELRTLMTKITAPLNSKKIQQIINILQNCSSVGSDQEERPKTDQQYGYKLPLITKNMLQNCKPITERLNSSKKLESKYQHDILGEEDIIFKMIKNNVTHLQLQLDDIRQKPKKFICLNDNIDHDKENVSSVKVILVDFYESLFPVPSQFELPDNVRNRYLYVEELRAWKEEQQVVGYVTKTLLVLLLVVFFLYIFSCPIRRCTRRIVILFWRCFRPPRLSTPSSTKLLTV